MKTGRTRSSNEQNTEATDDMEPTTGAGNEQACPVVYVLPSVWHLAEQMIDAQRRSRSEDPVIFHRYAEVLLRARNSNANDE